MNILSYEDLLQIANKEQMLEIWIEFAKESLCTHRTYGYDGKSFYILGERVWNPLYIKSYDNFIEYLEQESVFYDGSCLLKIK